MTLIMAFYLILAENEKKFYNVMKANDNKKFPMRCFRFRDFVGQFFGISDNLISNLILREINNFLGNFSI